MSQDSVVRLNLRGKWSTPGVPHKGWTCVGWERLAELQICEMCESQPIRYAHTMHHGEYPDDLVVGCECAANMEEDYSAAVEREKVLKGEEQRRIGWLDRPWHVSRKGNSFLKTRDGFHVVVYPAGSKWAGRVTDLQTNIEIKSQRKYATSDEVKLASLKAILLLKKKRIVGTVASKPSDRL